MIAAAEPPRVRPVRVLAVVAIVLAIYVTGSLAWPTTVPRLVALPRPADRGYDESCSPGGGGHVDERWMRSGLVWTRVRFHASGGCIGAT